MGARFSCCKLGSRSLPSCRTGRRENIQTCASNMPTHNKRKQRCLHVSHTSPDAVNIAPDRWSEPPTHTAPSVLVQLVCFAIDAVDLKYPKYDFDTPPCASEVIWKKRTLRPSLSSASCHRLAEYVDKWRCIRSDMGSVACCPGYQWRNYGWARGLTAAQKKSYFLAKVSGFHQNIEIRRISSNKRNLSDVLPPHIKTTGSATAEYVWYKTSWHL